MKTEEFILNNVLGQLNIEKTNINKLGIILNDIDKKTKNIKRGDAELDNFLKYNGTDWVPSSNPGGSNAVSAAQLAASNALGSKDSAVMEAGYALTLKNSVQAEAAAASSYETEAEASAAAAYTANASAISSLSLISSKANSNNPTFTGTVNLPSGTTINNDSIALQDKIMTTACYTPGSNTTSLTGLANGVEVTLNFGKVHKNNTGTPSPGSTSTIASASLWQQYWVNPLPTSGVRTNFDSFYGFNVPASKSGIYEISIQVTIDFGNTASSGSLFNITIYKRSQLFSLTYNDVHLMSNVFNLNEILISNPNERRQAAVHTLSRRAKDIVLLATGDTIFAKVKVEQRNAASSNWTIMGDDTYLNIREL